MQKKLLKRDIVFVLSMFLVLAMHLSCIYGPDHFADESFYPTIPLRLINGDSLVGDEWQLTQFSSLFLYVPVKLWLLIKGSTDGIVLYLRFFYLTIHTAASIGIYSFFRKYKLWAVAAALMFYSQVPLRFLSANYHSLLALFLLLLTLALLSIYKKDKLPLYIIAGFCYGCCCVCNPFDCALYAFYILSCIIWLIKSSRYKNKLSKDLADKAFSETKYEIGQRFFGVKAFAKFTTGLILAAAVSICFFFMTGGSLTSLVENIPHLLTDTGHDIFSSPLDAFVNKATITLKHIDAVSFGLPWLLPLFYFLLFFDKKRNTTKHRLIFTLFSLALSTFFTISVATEAVSNSRRLAITLPLAIASTASYILTENKNKKLFYFMWCPSAIATLFQYLASDLHLSTMWVLTIGNIAGIFFIKDFISEFKIQVNDFKNSKTLQTICQVCFCIVIALQVALQCGLYTVGRTVGKNSVPLEKGPYQGIYHNWDSYNRNLSIMQDLDEIKEMSEPDDHILIVSEFSWMYLYIDRPFGTYSAWMPYLELERLEAYYAINPEKIPEYIYVGWVYIPTGITSGHLYSLDRASKDVNRLLSIFDYQVQELANGYLLKAK